MIFDRMNLGPRTREDRDEGRAHAAQLRRQPCRRCMGCDGNAVSDDGYPCTDCEGTGCVSHPFCEGGHR